jgi:hypothetical protein
MHKIQTGTIRQIDCFDDFEVTPPILATSISQDGGPVRLRCTVLNR